MDRIYIPKKSEALQEEFFARHAEEVARDLLGRTLVREKPNKENLYAKIQEIAAYEGTKEESMSKGALYSPGTLAVSTKFGKRMLDIATYKLCFPSCITLISAVVSDKKGKKELIEGPGNLTKILEINKDDFDGLPLRLSNIWIGGNSIEEEQILKRNLSKLPRNCKGYFYFK